MEPVQSSQPTSFGHVIVCVSVFLILISTFSLVVVFLSGQLGGLINVFALGGLGIVGIIAGLKNHLVLTKVWVVGIAVMILFELYTLVMVILHPDAACTSPELKDSCNNIFMGALLATVATLAYCVCYLFCGISHMKELKRRRAMALAAATVPNENVVYFPVIEDNSVGVPLEDSNMSTGYTGVPLEGSNVSTTTSTPQ